MIKEIYKKDLEALLKIAQQQSGRINLSIILISLKCDQDDLSDILQYFEENGVKIINEDVEIDENIEENINMDRNVTPFDPSKIDIKMDKITVDSIIKRIKNDELEFDSSFQRKAGLWNSKQKSQLIESIFLKIPLPAFYFDASDDDKWQIIDGLQRIGTIKEYVVDKSFALTGMEFLRDLDGLKFDKLPRSLQRRIEETNLNAYLVNPSTPKNVKFNIFKRINTGGLILEPQEIRNALYQGQATKFLLELSQSEAFISATDHSIKTSRMLDREFCLRYIAFTQLSLENYSGNLDEFLNHAMDFLNEKNKKELSHIKDNFERTMLNCERIFGKLAFRRLNTEERRGPVNKALFDAWSVVVLNLDSSQVNALVHNKKALLKEFTNLCYDYAFQNYIRASDKYSVQSRIKEIKCLAEKIIKTEG